MENITVYSTQWCHDCRITKRFLRDKDISFTEIDIDRDDAAAEQVIQWSGGRRVIPTLLIQCSESQKQVILHNPPLAKLAEVLTVSL